MAAQQSLSFVILHGDTKPDRETARVIRANAMSWHQRKKYAEIQKQKELKNVHKPLRARIENPLQSSPVETEPFLSPPDLHASEKMVS
jgi:hypothetical protein